VALNTAAISRIIQETTMKVLLFAMLLLAPATASADLIAVAPATLHVTFSTCFSCFPELSMPSVNFDGILTVIPSTGTYFSPRLGTVNAGPSIAEVSSLSGTLNGAPVSLVENPLTRSWLGDDVYFPGYLTFTGGSVAWDGSYFIYDRTTAVGWRASIVPAPEPGSLPLLVLGVPVIFVCARRLGKPED
jgi:hypothetical protein